MLILLGCDCQIKAARLRQALERSGYDCPLGNVVPVDAVARRLPRPDLLLIVLPADHEQALATLNRIRESTDTHILAIGPRDPNLILGALRAGANDFVDEAGDLQNELAAALSRLSTAARARSPLGQLVTVVAASGGSGRTLVATNLAVMCAKTHLRCALFDFDLEGADVATLLDLKPRHTVADLCRNVDKLDQNMFEQSLLEHESGVHVLAAPESWDAAVQVSEEGLERVLKFGRTLYPIVVVDLGTFWLGEFTHLLQQSNTILLLCRLDLAAIRNARRTLEYFDRIRVDRDVVQVVASHCGRSKEISSAQLESVLEVKISHYVPEDAAIVNSCINCGVPLVAESPSCSIAKAISRIAKSVATSVSPTKSSALPASNGHSVVPVIEKMRAMLGMTSAARCCERT